MSTAKLDEHSRAGLHASSTPGFSLTLGFLPRLALGTVPLTDLSERKSAMEIPSKFFRLTQTLIRPTGLGGVELHESGMNRSKSSQIAGVDKRSSPPPQTRQQQLAVGFWYAPKRKRDTGTPRQKSNWRGKGPPGEKPDRGTSSGRGGGCPLTFLILALVCNHTRASRSARRVLHARGMRRLRAGVDSASSSASS